MTDNFKMFSHLIKRKSPERKEKEEILSILRQQSEIQKNKEEFYTLNPFYFNSLDVVGVFFKAKSYAEAILIFINYYRKKGIDFIAIFERKTYLLLSLLISLLKSSKKNRYL